MKRLQRLLSRATAGTLLPILALAAGCAVGPDFRKPESDLPATWAGAESAASADAGMAEWWTRFNDPVLTSLIRRAFESNLDLKAAESRIRQARATRAAAAAGQGPSADASGAYSRSQTGDRSAVSRFQAGFDAAWELDLFGGTRRSVEAADADLNAAVESRRDVLVTLAAEVAVNYMDLRALQQRIVIARNNLALQKRTVELTEKRFAGGFVSGLDAAGARAQVATTTAQIPALESSVRQAIYSLSVLLGKDPAALIEELSPEGAIPSAPPAVPIGVPSELLRRRPDIRAAEEAIHAATARIGVATADLFPKITLSGTLNWQAADMTSLFTPAARTLSLGPSVSWALFDSGRIRANIELKKALEEESFIAYNRTVLSALQEVENALIASTKEQERRTALETAVAAHRKTVALATQLYSEGQTDFMDVLDAQRSLNAAEDALVQSAQAVSTNLVALHKALGGGWSETDTTGR